MTATEIIAECTRRGIELRATETRIEWRPDAKLRGSLREALVTHKREVAKELRRDAAVGEAWDRLRSEYERTGQPGDWLHPDVRFAEHVVEQLWLSSRTEPDDDARFYRALALWERIAVEAIRGAANA